MARTITQRELRQARRLSRVLSLVVLLLGGGLLSAYFWLDGHQGRSVTAESAYLLASALVSAGLVALLLERATIEESRLDLQHTIEGTIESSLLPMRGLIERDCQVDYRWHCLLSMPPDDDSLPGYAFQQITIEKDVSDLPNELRFVCVSSMADDALAPFADDPRFQFRWIIDEGLDPHDGRIFDVARVSLDGQSLRGRQLSTRSRYPTRLLSYGVPRSSRDGRRHTVSFDVLVRKHFGGDRRVSINTQLFTTTFGADFRCTVSDNVPMNSAWIGTSQVATFGPMRPVTGEGRLVQGLPCSLHVRYSAPLQAGSGVIFYLDLRDDGTP